MGPKKRSQYLRNRSRKQPSSRRLLIEPLEERIALTLVPEIIDINMQPAMSTVFPVMEYNGNLIYVDGKEIIQTNGFANTGVVIEDNVSVATPDEFATLGDTILYAFRNLDSNDPLGTELFGIDLATSDGFVRDIFPGMQLIGLNYVPRSSAPNHFVSDGSLAYFFARSPSGLDIWQSDGTYSGTILAYDTSIGAQDSAVEMAIAAGLPVWVVEASGGGNARLGAGADFVTGLPAAQHIRNLTVADDGSVYFFLEPTSGSWQLYRLNGGTAELLDGALADDATDTLRIGSTIYYAIGNTLYAGSSTLGFSAIYTGANGQSIDHLTEYNGSLYFLESQDPLDSRWTLRDSSGSSIVANVVVGTVQNTSPIVAFEGALYFAVDDPATGIELWKSDGTPLGTQIVADLMAGSSSSYVDGIFAGSTKLFFQAVTGAGTFDNAFFETDGTSAGTLRLAAVARAINADSVTTSTNIEVNGMVAFVADDGINGRGIYTSDGTPSGTIRLDLGGLVPTSVIAILGSQILFEAGDQIWVTDGLTQALLGDNVTSGERAYAGNLLYYTVDLTDDFTSHTPLWVTDGTLAGTVLIDSNDISLRSEWAAVGDSFLYTRDNKIYVSDGTSSLALSLPAGSSDPKNFEVINGVVYFTLREASVGWTFWRTDGTQGGTYRIEDVGTGTTTSGVSAVFNDEYYTTANNMLYKTDGSAGGSVALTTDPIYSLAIDSWFVLGSNLFFFSDKQLYRTSGTPGDVELVLTLPATVTIQGSPEAVVLGDKAYFTYADESGLELWSTDGTAAGTGLAIDLLPGKASSNPRQLTAFNGELIFTASTLLGRESVIWSEDANPPVAAISSSESPIIVIQGDGIVLDASPSIDPLGAGLLFYDWDIDNDGVFGDASGITVALSWSHLVTLGIDTHEPIHIALRATTADGRFDITEVSLILENNPPVVEFASPPPIETMTDLTISLTATDSWPADENEGFDYLIDWDGDGTTDQTVNGPASGIVVSHVYSTSGNYTVRVRVQDRLGAESAEATHNLVVYGTPVTRFGPEMAINSYTTNSQAMPATAGDGAGTYVVAWEGSQDGFGSGVDFKLIQFGSGIPAVEVTANTWTTGSQQAPAVAMSSSGNFVIVWSGAGATDSIGIYAQRFDSTGTAIGSEFRVNTYTTSTQRNAAVAMDEVGNFVIVWESNGQDGSSYGVFGQLFDSSGASLGSEFQVNSYTSSNQSAATVAMDLAGNFVATWTSVGQDGSGSGIYAQRYDASGAKQGSEFRVNTYTASNQRRSAIAIDSNANFVIVWEGYGADNSDGIYAQRFGSDGLAIGSEFRVNKSTNSTLSDPKIAMDSNGDFVVSWTANSPGDGDGYGIYGRTFNAAGEGVGDDFLINSYTGDEQTNSSIAIDDSGNFLVVWRSENQDGSSNGVFGQFYTSYFQPGFTYTLYEGNSLSLNGVDPTDPVDGSYTYAWDLDNDGSFDDAFGSRPTLTWTELSALGISDGPGTFPISVRVTTQLGSNDYAATLQVMNAAPVISVTPTGLVTPGQPIDVTISAFDISDAPFGLTYEIDWDNNGTIDETHVSSEAIVLSRTFAQGQHTFKVFVTDKDGAIASQTVNIVANVLPVANPGGPYVIAEGESLTLNGSLSTDTPGDIVTYSWDLNGDGIYGDAMGVSPTLTWSQLSALGIVDGPATYNVRVRVTDSLGYFSTSAPVSLAIQPAAPTAQINGWNYLVRGQTRDFYFAATDPSPGDQNANMTYQIDWDGNGSIDQTIVGSAYGVTTPHLYAASGSYTIRVTATDRDGMTSAVAEMPVTVVNWALLQDPSDSSKTDLHWGGTTGIDAYGFVPGGYVFKQAENNQFFATPQVVHAGSFNGKLYVYAQGGNDLLFADVMNQPVVFFGGDGDDVLVGGRSSDYLDGGEGNDILLGGTSSLDGDDTIFGGAGSDFIVGQAGADLLDGGTGQDLVMAGTLFFIDSLPSAVYSIQAEWLSGRPLADRVANLSGTGSGPRNNGDFFLAPGVTALDDGAVDQVLGGDDQDWLLADLQTDLLPDLSIDEIATDLV